MASGLADHLGLSLLAVRVGLVALSAVAGFGVVLYAVLWIFVPLQRDQPEAPGLAAARRSGLRTSARRFRVGDAGQLLAFAALGLGALLLGQRSDLGVDPVLFWPALVVGCGVLLIWRQGDESARDREPAGGQRDFPVSAVASAERSVPPAAAAPCPQLVEGGWFQASQTNHGPPIAASRVRAVPVRTAPRARRGWRGAFRVLAGTALVLGGLTTFIVTSGRLDVARDVFFGGVVAAVGIALVGGPWLLQTFRSLRLEREERILSQERADVAAHLHDSVLQTLALIQRQSQDPREVVRLARSQERDLRGWLYGQQRAPDTSFRTALERVGAEVEEEYGVPVEVVVVGDCPTSDRISAVVLAAREALVNAAKHAGADRTDVYAEIDEHDLVAYVRDRGVGFDPDAVDERRLGLRHSVVERMSRHGGRASVRSGPGEGTEVRLEMALDKARSRQ